MATPRKVEFVIGARDQTRRAFRRIRGGLRRITRSVLSFRTLVGGVFAGAAIRGLDSFAEGLEKVNDNAASLGLTTDELQGLQFAAREVGLSGNDVLTVFQRLRRRMGEAEDGSALMIEQFDKLGISFDDIVNKTPAEVFTKILENAKEMSAALADARIGKVLDVEGLKLARLFRQEFDGVADAVERARAARFIRSPAQLKAASEFREQMRAFGDIVRADLTPSMLEFGKIITDNTPTIVAALKALTEALALFVRVVLAIPKVGAAIVEGAASFGRSAARPGFTAGGRLIDDAIRAIGEIRDNSNAVERRAKTGDTTGVYGS